MTTILDGLAVSKAIRASLKEETDALLKQDKRAPSLTVVIVGNDPASQTYVNSKVKQCKSVGFSSQAISCEEDTTQEALLEIIHTLNHDEHVDGILVQLPLPKHIDENVIIEAIDPKKDVDGLHPLNVGYLELNRPGFVSCTPKGIVRLLDWYNVEIEGKRALVIGRSRLVGKPVSTLLTQKNATVTLAHSKTKNLEELVRSNDIIVVAMGKPESIPSSWISDQHVLVDVGIHRVDGNLRGDVDRHAYEIAAYATPVPKGVGPMTIASLLENTMIAYKLKECQHD
ncbi:bifunctional 5,10-methylenetetrahydrofolate dehydrogenase/5,10-methenyltetrahydrofolate cyclohydrolase [Erysipelothrix rhusiopathiae]|uniref:bifunctional 5,10-methylenetetrahydrofolate dehydrogenase/5,10-methenyltetrahydrofolate cyclohydrolase n=1 Tax=Erysipelothrix rhusiopathiae TaxID=1648 RepID=UPI000F43557B|nr:bifunctional 5,10-methylenetetrahydrofolate dehydrogenase/5,10-methenyltetrahydrofolate cyclohydrolase [Erysipelothrix rhusiopathiae]AYV33878.1 bifunctional 5,10-methylenetetrahydrofolate dehydrogenase/5,10-methenyltetrahydrofolate cyclohydrolase [Erysipelothrix rhusiopathiae]MDE8081476.1 bifunctional 5,10-methylenetetrahydrofolate dehydrogenase/5,10-methenyltetrahydrofolate cyclohydrolase [Erysipelothrix rhusiopathiae]MDE8328700.1 bifunctional 5,10-methylenetetrahydrofolate dehydrogenase/5,1